MTIQKLDDFAENGDKNLTGIDVQQGFVQAEKPARQWFNWLFNSINKKVNEVIDGVNSTTQAIEDISIDTDKIVDSAVTTEKLADESITGDKIVKDAELNTPKLSATYALTTLDAPNINLAADGTLKRSNDPLNASTRKVGTALGNLVERDANGYPSNNNALGVGQTWQDMTASRSSNVTYTNTTGRPIFVFALARVDAGTNDALVNGVAVGSGNSTAGIRLNTVVPAGATYMVKSSFNLWSELR